MALTLTIKVVPNAGRTGWQLDKNGQLKCFLKSAPEKGAANKELIKTISKLLKIPQQAIEIVTGLTDRNKRIKIHGAFSLPEIFSAFGISETQQTLT